MRTASAFLLLALAAPVVSAQSSVRYRVERYRLDGVPWNRYDVRLPRLTSGASPSVRAGVNTSIREIANTAYTCGESGAAPPGFLGEEVSPERRAFLVDSLGSMLGGNARSTVTRSDARFFSFVVEGSIFCAGAHPNNTQLGYTFDLRTGKRVEDYGLDSTKAEALWSEAYRDILPGLRRDSVRADQLPEDQRDCAQIAPALHSSGSEYSSTWNVALSSRGLLLWPELPHVVQGCTVRGLVPYARLRPYLSPSSPLLVR
ncbi:MAG: hypothetical protein LCH53_04575 [Bacteroidetes bacterium]|nr:hypothetical protein [Bacteroidota bacterium]